MFDNESESQQESRHGKLHDKLFHVLDVKKCEANQEEYSYRCMITCDQNMRCHTIEKVNDIY